MIESLFLRNFRRFESYATSFTEGMNGIFGANYQGKTTIQTAIAVALAGPGWARGMNLARRGQTNFEIQLVFSVDGKQYRVMRSKSGASLHRIAAGQDDQLLANQQGNVTAEIGKLIGMHPTRWLELRYVRQKKASTMFEEGAAKLNTLVEELSGVRTVSHVIDRLGTRLKTVTTQLETLASQEVPDDTLAQWREEVQAASEAFTKAEAELERLKTRHPELEASARATAGRARALANNLQDARAELHDAERKAKAADDAKETLENTPKMEGDEKVLRNRYEELRLGVDNWQSWLREVANLDQMIRLRTGDLKATEGATEEAIAEAKAQAKSLKQQVKELGFDIEALEVIWQDARNTMHEAKTKLVMAEEQLESGVCQACGTTLTDLDPDDQTALVAQYRKELATASEAATEAQGRYNEARRSFEQLTRDRYKAKEQRDRLIEQFEGRAGLVQDLEDKQKQRTGMLEGAEVADLDEVRSGVQEMIVEAEDLDLWLRKLTKANAAWKVAKAAYDKAVTARNASATTLTKADLDEMQEQQEVVQKELDGLREQVIRSVTGQEKLAEQLVGYEKLISVISERIHEQDKLTVTMRRLRESEHAATGLRKHLRDNRSRYLQRAWDLMMGRASGFASSVTDGFISSVSRTEDGTFEFVEDGETAQVVDASGAQAAILGMAVQTSLAETLPTKLDLFMADEPTADMDAEHSGAALIALSTLAKQAVVISHHRMDESLCSQVEEL